MHRVKKIDLQRVEAQRKFDQKRRNPKSDSVARGWKWDVTSS